MKSSDRMIVLGVAILGLAAAFWFLILSPKREEAAELQTQVTELESQVVTAEQAAATGEVAKKDFSHNYRQLISLGKAVPVDADTPSLLTQLQELSVDAGVNFRSITLSGGGAAASGAAPAAAPTDPVAAAESSAAALPIGATVGTAGLPTMPYELTFDGGFFEIADFFGEVDGMVESVGEKTIADGRLLTIDGFNFVPGPDGLPELTATVTATSYLTPIDQGLTAGATPAGPAPDVATPAATPPADGSTTPPVSSAVVAN
ncbi:MAG TPA: type 4a pilus biogenesis protein PilO [Solirubrobacterales bacterium]|nr:type 4a pilus biogenesis protein PilO [Solirubrobacterales bacterium]